jgi:hypothetical protein
MLAFPVLSDLELTDTATSKLTKKTPIESPSDRDGILLVGATVTFHLRGNKVFMIGVAIFRRTYPSNYLQE